MCQSLCASGSWIWSPSGATLSTPIVFRLSPLWIGLVSEKRCASGKKHRELVADWMVDTIYLHRELERRSCPLEPSEPRVRCRQIRASTGRLFTTRRQREPEPGTVLQSGQHLPETGR